MPTDNTALITEAQMAGEAATVTEGLRAAGVDADIFIDTTGPMVTFNPGDASTFLELLGGDTASSEAGEIVAGLARCCPHSEQRCRLCNWLGASHGWPIVLTEHASSCPWLRAKNWVRRHP